MKAKHDVVQILLECPYCGAKATNSVRESCYDGNVDKFFISCPVCEMQGPHCLDHDYAINAWENLRRIDNRADEAPKLDGI